MGIFSVFPVFLPIFSEGGGPKKFLEQKILKTYSKNIFDYKNNILDFKKKF